MSDPQNLEGDRYDTMAAEIVTECVDTGKAGLAGWELANLQDAIGNALRTRLAEVEAENERLRLEKRPVAWRCKGYGDGWIIFQNEERALEYQEKTGCLMQGLYPRAALAQTKEPSDDDNT